MQSIPFFYTDTVLGSIFLIKKSSKSQQNRFREKTSCGKICDVEKSENKASPSCSLYRKGSTSEDADT